VERLGLANRVLFLEESSDTPEILDAVHQQLDQSKGWKCAPKTAA
jgi:hypothetical protein